jgi:hypothetical protein
VEPVSPGFAPPRLVTSHSWASPTPGRRPGFGGFDLLDYFVERLKSRPELSAPVGRSSGTESSFVVNSLLKFANYGPKFAGCQGF